MTTIALLSPHLTLQTPRTAFYQRIYLLKQPRITQSMFFSPRCPVSNIFRQILGVIKYLTLGQMRKTRSWINPAQMVKAHGDKQAIEFESSQGSHWFRQGYTRMHERWIMSNLLQCMRPYHSGPCTQGTVQRELRVIKIAVSGAIPGSRKS